MTRWWWFLKSRKVQVAIATIVAAIAAQYGWQVSEENIYTILAMGAALILGIAHEDNGAKAGKAGRMP